MLLLALAALLAADPAPAPTSKIAFMRQGKVCLVNADGTGLQVLTELEYDRPLAWSPDGTRLLYWKHSDMGWDIWSMDAQGKNQTNLTKTKAGGCRSPSWSPDGKRIAFMRDATDTDRLFVMDADGGNAKRLSGEGHRDSTPAWSPNSRRLAFADFDDIFVVDADGRNEARLAKDAAHPSWSKDGRKVLFAGRRKGNWEICLIDVESKQETNLTNSPDVEREPTWSPDGRFIAFAATSKEIKTELRVMAADGTNVRKLTDIEYSRWITLSWSPDGAWLAFEVGEGKTKVVKVVDIAGKQVRTLAEGASFPVWQPRVK